MRSYPKTMVAGVSREETDRYLAYLVDVYFCCSESIKLSRAVEKVSKVIAYSFWHKVIVIPWFVHIYASILSLNEGIIALTRMPIPWYATDFYLFFLTF